MNKLKWMINRLSVMSPLEVEYRIKDEITKKLELICFKDFILNLSLNLKKVNWYSDLTALEKLFLFIKDKGTRYVGKGRKG